MTTSARNATTTYDPWDLHVLADPYPAYEALRADGGCHELPDLGMWVLSTYDLVRSALGDHGTFSSVGGVSRLPDDRIVGWINEDPPGHDATRALATPVFKRSAVAGHRDAVRAGAEDAVSRFVGAGGGDVVSELAEPIAVHALCEVLGVPNRWSAEMVAMSEATFVDISARTPEDRTEGLDQLHLAVGIALSEVIEAQLNRDVPDPSANVLAMITAHAGEDAGFVTLDAYGRAAYLTTLVSPGVETTRTMIANAVELAARHPEVWDQVRSGQVSAWDFVEEVLRYESPIQGFFRTTTRSVDMGGVTIPRGARVLCLYGSANRDEAVFGNASTFRAGRANAGRHLAFGAGIHRCIGAALAQTEGIAAIEALARRVERFEVTDLARRTDMAQLRAFERLEVLLTLSEVRKSG